MDFAAQNLSKRRAEGASGRSGKKFFRASASLRSENPINHLFPKGKGALSHNTAILTFCSDDGEVAFPILGHEQHALAL